MSIPPLQYNMSISRRVYEEPSKNAFLSTVQKIAVYLVIPMAFILIFEAVVKNLVLINLANLGICLLNGLHQWTVKPPW